VIKNVYIRVRPGTDTNVSDLFLIEICDTIRDTGLYIIRNKDEINKETLILALGGDGTMLSAMHIASETGALVTGFNYGNLGYLMPDSAKTTSRLIAKLTELLYSLINPNRDLNSYMITKYSMPVLLLDGHPALNDFYFVPSANGSAADFTVSIGNSNFTTKSSGMVVSTPSGSTGLALSAGGSILAPDSKVLQVVPMLPHTLTSRPIIVPLTDKISISWDRKVQVFADGRMLDDFGSGSVTLTCKKHKINIVRPSTWDFFENLKSKMKWHT